MIPEPQACGPSSVLLSHSGLTDNDGEQREKEKLRSAATQPGPLNPCADSVHLAQRTVSQGLSSAAHLVQDEFRDEPVWWYQAGKDPAPVRTR